MDMMFLFLPVLLVMAQYLYRGPEKARVVSRVPDLDGCSGIRRC